MTELTASQQRILGFIDRFYKLFGYMPTTRDIQDEFGYASQTSSVNHLKALQRKGYIERTSKKARAMRIIKSLVNENDHASLSH